MTVTGTTCPSSSKIWVMPIFLPIMPFMLPPRDCGPGACSTSSRASRILPASLEFPIALGVGPVASPADTRQRRARAAHPSRKLAWRRLDLDLDVHARPQVQPHQRVDRFAVGLQHVDQALVCPDLEVLL